ncbi:unnamed protein product [Brachionus calyciflorus]|uniref:Calcium-transporting ATPase n=1 Tax=Brachionus calyciflorus TaxID=104777 RepID=A0A813VQK7_9BILA|nr:unnamed protein product [Brachionus calyciflorus]
MSVYKKSNEEIVGTEQMHNKSEPTTSASARNGAIDTNNFEFNIKVNDLKDLIQLKGPEATERIRLKFGDAENLAQNLHTDILNGLNDKPEQLKKRVRVYGKNEIPPKPPKTIFQLAFEALQDTTLVMLMICSVISISLSFYHPSDEKEIVDEEFRSVEKKDLGNLEWVEGAAIMIAVVVVVFVTAFNDWRKEKQFRGLQDQIESDNLASVIRNGQMIQINVKEIVVGDICCIKYGDLIPADGLVVNSSDLKIDESSLTGETDLIKKNSHENAILLSGTHVMEGSGQFLVLAVGLNSQTGIIMTLLGATSEEKDHDSEQPVKKKKNSKKYDKISPEQDKPLPEEIKEKKKKSVKKHRSVLQIKLGKLALQIGYIGMLSAFCTFIILVIRMSIEEFIIKGRQWSNIYIKYIIAYLIQGITVIVVAVPEGLPLAVTLALAFAVRKMTKDNNLVRHLDACETMGNATTICSDKTGTLTTNRMTAVECWIADKHYKKIPKELSPKLFELISESISVNTNYTSRIEQTKVENELPKQIGNKTECALLGLVNELGGNFEMVRKEFPNDQFVKVYTFNSARKMMSTIVRNKSNPNSFRLYSKGASEMVLSKCGWYLDSDGRPVKLDEEKISNLIHTVVEPMAVNGLRTLCVAYREFSSLDEANQNEPNAKLFDTEPNWDDEDLVINDLTCLCLVGIEDPVRPEVPDAIRKCQTSGVVVRMITGDNINTATSIAMKCGIVKPGDDFLILESKDFNRRIRDEHGEVKQHLLDKVWPKLRVLARSSPTDKHILVNGIVESKNSVNREVVAVTGDGTNDGPALKRADVGFAMGIQGTDVAKEASDIILTDDNFSSIVKAMMWGRNVYDAIAKFLQFQLTANFSAGIFSVVCAATIQAVPLKAVQMLWVNLVMDTLASLALATEPPTEDLLKRKPYGRNKSIISYTMLKNMLGHAVYQLIVLFFLVYKIEDWMQVESVIRYNDLNKLREPSVHFTIIFNAFVLMTLFNEINARKIHNERNVFSGIQRNMIFLLIWIFCFIGQILIVNFGGIIFAVERLELDQWMWCMALGFGSLIWGQVITTIPTSAVKKFAAIFKGKKPEEIPLMDLEEEIDQDQDAIEKSKLLWMRGAHRLSNQMKVVEVFQAKLNEVIDASDLGGSVISLKDRVRELSEMNS